MGYENVPADLRALRQWLCWKYEPSDDPERPTKVPYQVSGFKCDVTNPAHWTDFETVLNAVAFGQFSGIGMAFASLEQGGKYTGIDLDYTQDPELIARQKLIHDQFDSYSEISPSGKGCHIIIEAMIPHGRKRAKIEMYSDKRFLTFTGNVYNNKPIAKRQELATILYEEMSRSQGIAINFEGESERDSDDDILTQGASAPLNGERFKALYEGRWKECGYPSQSEADFAFIDMVANYTKNKEQLRRIFLKSWLGARDKAQRRPDYVNRMVERAFDRVLGPIDFSKFGQSWKNNGPTVAAAGPLSGSPVSGGSQDETSIIHLPSGVKALPGLMGEIANYIYWQSHRPVQEIAACAAIALVAGIVGRQFNTPTGAGLNLYTVLVAQTAVGKEAMASGVSKLIGAIKKGGVASIDTFVGPSSLASGPALLRRLETQNCCLSIVTEFGHMMQNMCAKNAPPHLVTLRSVLLDAYTKSGRGNVIRPSVYSEKEKNILDIHEPAYSILAESTPSTFYENLDESLISMGLMARLMIIEYHGDRVDANPHLQPIPPVPLVTKLGSLAAYCMTNHKNDVVIQTQFSDGSKALSDKFDQYCDMKVRENQTGAIRDLFGRAHLTVMKLASLFAICENFYHPVMSPDNWIMAQELVERAVNNINQRFAKGDVGKVNLEPQQLDMIREYVARYIQDWLLPKKLSTSYGITQKMLDDGVVPFSYFNSTMGKKSVFNSGFGDKGAAMIRRTLKIACDLGLLMEIKEGKRFIYGSEKLMYQIRELPTS